LKPIRLLSIVVLALGSVSAYASMQRVGEIPPGGDPVQFVGEIPPGGDPVA